MSGTSCAVVRLAGAEPCPQDRFCLLKKPETRMKKRVTAAPYVSVEWILIVVYYLVVALRPACTLGSRPGVLKKFISSPASRESALMSLGCGLGGAVLQSLPEAAGVHSWDLVQWLVTHRSSVNRQEGEGVLGDLPGVTDLVLQVVEAM